MTFAHAGLAFLAGVVLVAGCAAQCHPFGTSTTHPNLHFLMRATGARWWPNTVVSATASAGIALLVLAAATPLRAALVPADAAIAVCLDTSGSMNTADVPPSRARAAAAAIGGFISAKPDTTRIAILTFSGTARLLTALTANRFALYRALKSVPDPNGQTAIGDALLLARAQLPASGSRAIIVLTDGKNNHGSDPAGILRALRAERISVAIVPVRRGADPARDLMQLRTALTLSRSQRDLTPLVTCVGLVLLAAAWLARERGAFGL